MAIDGKRVAALRRDGFQGGKTIQGQATQAVHATADHRIAHPEVQQTLRAQQRPRARGTGGGNAKARPAQTQPVTEKIRRFSQLLLRVVIMRRQLALVEIGGDALAGFLNARGAGAEYHGDTLGAETADGGAQFWLDFQRGSQQQLVIAARRMVRQIG